MSTKRNPANRYLWFRDDSAVIWFRMAVPKAHWHTEGKTPVAEPLGTTDVREARVLAGKRRAELLAEWGAVPKLPAKTSRPTLRVPNDAELEEAAVVLGYELPSEEASEGRQSLRGKGPNMFRGHVSFVHAELEDQMRAAATGDLLPVRELANEAIDALGFDLPLGSAGYNKLCELLNVARVAGLREQHRRNNGDLEGEPESQLIQRVRQRQSEKAKVGETILELFEVYAAGLLQIKNKRPAGVDQDRMVLTQFADFVGRDSAASAVGYEEAKEFVDALAKVPAGYNKRKAYRGLMIRQAIEKGQREKLPVLSPITQQRYISAVSPFFAWLKSDRGGRRVQANPFDGLHLDIRNLKKKNARPPFTADQITTIIHSPVFTGFRADGKEHLPGNERADDWRYWIPLICLFTGARIGEAAQLQVEDVFRVGGVWCVEFRSDEEAGQKTKNDKSRIVALHSILLKIGLPDFVDRQRKRATRDGNCQLFPDLKSGPRDQFGDGPSKWFRHYLQKIGVKLSDARDGFGSHSFRHTLADQLRAAGHLDDVFGPLIHGHYKGGITGDYGEARQGTPGLLSSLIESVKFVPIVKGRVVEGGAPVDFSHLFPRHGLPTVFGAENASKKF